MNLSTLPLFERLRPYDRILLAGAGGGFDLFTGLPLYFALEAMGKQVTLANLSFSQLEHLDGEYLTPDMLTVRADTEGQPHYFPEKYLSEWFREARGQEVPVYAFMKTGVQPLRRAYQAIIDRHEIQAIVLVDGGTDSLMRGDEPGLGTPSEDMLSLAAVRDVEGVEDRLLLCLGFGIDTFHGVDHHYFLEAVAELTASGAFLGAFSCMEQMPEVQAYQQAIDHVHRRMPLVPSIVNTSIQTALCGDFGNVHRTARTRGSELYINPLMTLYFCFDLVAVALRVAYIDMLRHTERFYDVMLRIEGYRSSIARQVRPRRTLPM